MNVNAKEILEEIKKPKLTFDLLPSVKRPTVTTLSHVGGKPFILEKQHPPLCHHCKKPMAFVFQLNVPRSETECNLYVFYYCFSCKPTKGNKGFAILNYPNPDINKAKQDVSKSKITLSNFEFELYWSLPDWESLAVVHPEVAEYFMNLDDEEFDIKYDETKEEFLDMWNFDTFSFYGGYPNFLNGPVFPTCDCCNKIMKPWIQFDSYDELGFYWNKHGVLHIFKCANEKENYKIIIQ